MQQGNSDGFLSLDFGLNESGLLDNHERLRRYRQYVYEVSELETGHGARISPEIAEKERCKGYSLTRKERFLYNKDKGKIRGHAKNVKQDEIKSSVLRLKP